MTPPRPRLLFLVTEDWYFYSHRLPMARAAQRAGFDVALLTHVDSHRALIEQEGIKVIPFSLDRGSLNPFRALLHIAKLRSIYRRERPDIAHHIAMKPVLLGSITAWLAKTPCVINAFAGLGYAFTSDENLARMLRVALIPVFRILLKRKNSFVLLQNPDDKMRLSGLRMIAEDRTIVIRGSGVDLKALTESPLPAGPDFICVFAGRMIDIKGLPTLKEAFTSLRQTHPRVKLWLCGEPDSGNPGSWAEERLRAWAAENPNVIYKGRCAMAEIWPQAHLALQPSWGGEGIPKALLEAAACGRPIAASDVPGCREVVQNNVNGLLTPPHDSAALAAAIAKLADNVDLCRSLAAQSRAVVRNGLSVDDVMSATGSLYRRCLQDTSKPLSH